MGSDTLALGVSENLFAAIVMSNFLRFTHKEQFLRSLHFGQVCELNLKWQQHLEVSVFEVHIYPLNGVCIEAMHGMVSALIDTFVWYTE
jgi:hypothetical protein